MTFSLRRKRPTTAPGKSTRSRTACSLACLLTLAAGTGSAEPAPHFKQLPPAEPVFKAAGSPAAIPVFEPPPRPAAPARIITVLQADPKKLDMPPVDASGAPDPLRDQSLFEPPSPDSLFSRLDSEKSFEQRLRQQGIQKNPPEIVKFPDRPMLTQATFPGRQFPPQACCVEPAFVCYDRLYFEEKNAERYGWDLGFIQPFVSVAYFYKDVLFLPHNFARDPHRRFECNAGYCLPGDPVPYILYPPEISLGGTIAEGMVTIALIALFHGF